MDTNYAEQMKISDNYLKLDRAFMFTFSFLHDECRCNKSEIMYFFSLCCTYIARLQRVKQVIADNIAIGSTTRGERRRNCFEDLLMISY